VAVSVGCLWWFGVSQEREQRKVLLSFNFLLFPKKMYIITCSKSKQLVS